MDTDYAITECNSGNTSFDQNFILVVIGTGETHTIRYRLTPLGNSVSLQIPECLQIMFPDNFTAEQNTISVSRIHLEIGPYEQGQVIDHGAYSSVHNPVFNFMVNVTLDGNETPNLEHRMTVGKYCIFTSGGGLFGRYLTTIPTWWLGVIVVHSLSQSVIFGNHRTRISPLMHITAESGKFRLL